MGVAGPDPGPRGLGQFAAVRRGGCGRGRIRPAPPARPGAAQYLQLAHAADGGPLRQNTAEALAAFDGLAPADALAALRKAWALQQNLTQLLKVALGDNADPTDEPKAFRTLLARAGDVRDFRALRTKLESSRKGARSAYETIVGA